MTSTAQRGDKEALAIRPASIEEMLVSSDGKSEMILVCMHDGSYSFQNITWVVQLIIFVRYAPLYLEHS